MKKVLTKLLVLLFFVGGAAFGQGKSFVIPFSPSSGPQTSASYVRASPNYTDARVLAASTNEAHTIPAGATMVIFSATCAAFYAIVGGTAAVPAADVTNGTASELNPIAWYLPTSATQVALIAPTACTITLSWYSL